MRIKKSLGAYFFLESQVLEAVQIGESPFSGDEDLLSSGELVLASSHGWWKVI
jgi:hypothetical protein